MKGKREKEKEIGKEETVGKERRKRWDRGNSKARKAKMDRYMWKRFTCIQEEPQLVKSYREPVEYI